MEASVENGDQLALVRMLRSQNEALSVENVALKTGGGGGNYGGMEPRIATLEADMKNVKEQLSKLADVPADLATLKERTSHLPTKSEMQTEINNQLERLGNRMQRQVTITGGIFAAILAAITLGARFIGS